jgi:hypothetical protein
MIRDPRLPKKQQKEGFPLYLLTALIIGLVFGLIISWLVFPVRASGISPSELSPLAKEEYRIQIAMAYATSGDAQRAAARLNLLADRDPIRDLNVQAQLALLNQDSQREARALSQLSQAIYDLVLERLSGEEGGGIVLLEGSAFSIIEQQKICEDASSVPLLKIFLLDNEGQPYSGIRFLLKSDAGEEESFTGLRPEFGAGYVQFDLFPNEVYALELQDAETLSGIHAPSCDQEDEDDYWGSWLLTLAAD